MALYVVGISHLSIEVVSWKFRVSSASVRLSQGGNSPSQILFISREYLIGLFDCPYLLTVKWPISHIGKLHLPRHHQVKEGVVSDTGLVFF